MCLVKVGTFFPQELELIGRYQNVRQFYAGPVRGQQPLWNPVVLT